MNIGLPSGFVQFDTLACDILRYMSIAEYVSQRELQENVSEHAQHISVTLIRLQKYGFIHKVGKDRVRGERSYAVFSLDPYSKAPYVKTMSGMVRSRIYRAKKRMKVASVFDFRGEVRVG